jgi:transcription antitermination factor NusG
VVARSVSEFRWGEVAASPRDLAEASDWVTRAAGRWWVIYTRARHEKAVAQALAERGVLHFLPLIPVHHTYARGRATYDVPLFPGYLFLCGAHGDCETARRTNRIVQLIDVPDQARLRVELARIARVLEHGTNVQRLMGIQVGRRCRVRAGPLRDLEGVVVQEGQRCRMHLAVSMLGQSVVVEIDAALLEQVA